MKLFPVLLLVLLASLAFACDNRSTTTVVIETGEYVFLDGQIVNMVEVVQVTEGMSADLKDSQIRLKSRMSTPATIYIRARFYDAAGREVVSSFTHWNPVIIAARSEKSYSAAAPSATVTRIKFEIRSSSSEASITPGKDRD